MKTVLVTNVITKTVFAICVTILAISFNNISVLWWFILLPFLGCSYTETPIKKGGAE